MSKQRAIVLIAIIGLIVFAGCSRESNVSNPVCNDEQDAQLNKPPDPLLEEKRLSGDENTGGIICDIDSLSTPGSVFECDDAAINGFIHRPFWLIRNWNDFDMETESGGTITIVCFNGSSRTIKSRGYLKITITDFTRRAFIPFLLVPPVYNNFIHLGRLFGGNAGHVRVEWDCGFAPVPVNPDNPEHEH